MEHDNFFVCIPFNEVFSHTPTSKQKKNPPTHSECTLYISIYKILEVYSK